MKGINKGPPREAHSREFVPPLQSKRQKEEASLPAQKVKNLPARQETRVQSLNQEDPLEKGMATHSNILAWRIPWKEGPGGLQSMGSQRVRHDGATRQQ